MSPTMLRGKQWHVWKLMRLEWLYFLDSLASFMLFSSQHTDHSFSPVEAVLLVGQQCIHDELCSSLLETFREAHAPVL